MKKILILFIAALCTFSVEAQTKLTKVYNETINPLTQIENAVNQAKKQKKHVICQLGGNWCIWCLRLADFITKDEEINNFINDNYVYIHVNYNPKNATLRLPRTYCSKRKGRSYSSSRLCIPRARQELRPQKNSPLPPMLDSKSCEIKFPLDKI